MVRGGVWRGYKLVKEREDGNKVGRVEEGDRGWGGEGSAGSAGRVVR